MFIYREISCISNFIALQMVNLREGSQATYLFPIVIVLPNGIYSPVVFFWYMH